MRKEGGEQPVSEMSKEKTKGLKIERETKEERMEEGNRKRGKERRE